MWSATAVTTTMVVEAPGVVTKSALHPPLPESVAMINVPEAAEMVNLAPTISKASAATFMIEEIGDYGLDSPSSQSPITPPAMPLIAPGFPQPGTPASAFRAISAPGDPDDESPMLECMMGGSKLVVCSVLEVLEDHFLLAPTVRALTFSRGIRGMDLVCFWRAYIMMLSFIHKEAEQWGHAREHRIYSCNTPDFL